MYEEWFVAKCIERQCTQKLAAFAASVVPIHVPGITLHVDFAAYWSSILQSVYIHLCRCIIWHHRIFGSLVIGSLEQTLSQKSKDQSQFQAQVKSPQLIPHSMHLQNILLEHHWLKSAAHRSVRLQHCIFTSIIRAKGCNPGDSGPQAVQA